MGAFEMMGALDARHREAFGIARGTRPEAMPADDRFPPANAYDYDARGSARPVKITPAFKFVPVGDLEYRDPEFLVADLIETDGLGMLFGDPGCGKSFLAADLALCVASGADFHGRAVMQGPVLFIAGEGHNGLTRRFAAWSKERGVSLKGLPMFKSERAAQFLDGASAQAVADAADALAQAHGAPQLIVIDTLARNFGSGDENNTQDMSNFVVAMDDLKARYPGCVILIVHHSGHQEKNRARGAMALKGALDFEYRIEKEGSAVQFVNTKMKDAEPPADLFFTLETVQLHGHATSAVLRDAEKPERQDRRTPAQKLALATYEAAAVEHGVWDGNGFRGVHVDNWREAFNAKHTGDSTEAKKKAYQRVRADLVNAGVMDVRDDVYLTKDAAVQAAIIKAPKPHKDPTGTSGTSRDIPENVPVQKRDEPGQSGQAPKGCPVSRPRLGDEEQKEGDKAECPPVPLSPCSATEPAPSPATDLAWHQGDKGGATANVPLSPCRSGPVTQPRNEFVPDDGKNVAPSPAMTPLDPDAIRAAFDDYAATDNPKDERATP